MAFSKKTWVNRQSEYPARRTLIAVDGEADTYDVTRAEGSVTTEGDAFNAANMNDLENRIDAEFQDINEKQNGLSLWAGTQAQYNAITTKDNNTLYFIQG